MLGSASANVDVVGFLDSPAWIDIKPFVTTFPGFSYITQQVHSFANVDHLGLECSGKYVGLDAWKCMFGQYRLPTVSTPYFLVASQYDAFQLGNNVGQEPASAAQQTYSEGFAQKTRDLGNEVAALHKTNVVYSWSCYNHCMSESYSGFNTHTCDPHATTMTDAFKQFLGWAAVDTRLFQDTCTTFGCGSGCFAVYERKGLFNSSDHLIV